MLRGLLVWLVCGLWWDGGEALDLIPSCVSSWDCSMKLGTRVVMWWTSIIALEPRSTFSLVLCTVSPDIQHSGRRGAY